MNWIKTNRRLIICWAIILLVAPFFTEALLFANIMGAEATVGFLVLLYSEYKANYELRKYQIREFASLVFRTLQDHPICQINIYCFHTSSSIVLLVVTGSMTYAILAWYPLLAVSNKIGEHV
ncbi:hypothetical protein BST96_06770 [Oceanicoccus sagamiensis]|uniref:Uncharacterized protein n=1 Tax=Oceanicoccus sagamiensis TaxID=716816 RepID=A0A1X9NBM7_9GAMM|nr:hypothetical protein BST96_06770 [Oceanicoccus sagamiensis]